MRKVRKSRIVFMTLILVALVYLPIIIKHEYVRRGYFAIGGEYLIVPVIILFWLLYEMIGKFINECE